MDTVKSIIWYNLDAHRQCSRMKSYTDMSDQKFSYSKQDKNHAEASLPP